MSVSTFDQEVYRVEVLGALRAAPGGGAALAALARESVRVRDAIEFGVSDSTVRDPLVLMAGVLSAAEDLAAQGVRLPGEWLAETVSIARALAEESRAFAEPVDGPEILAGLDVDPEPEPVEDPVELLAHASDRVHAWERFECQDGDGTLAAFVMIGRLRALRETIAAGGVVPAEILSETLSDAAELTGDVCVTCASVLRGDGIACDSCGGLVCRACEQEPCAGA